MFILETSACTSASVLATVLFIKKLIKILSIIVPAILVLLLSIDFAKAVISSDEDKMKRAQNLAIKRIIYGLIIFFVPMIVDYSFKLLDNANVSFSGCYNNATEEVVTVLRQSEDEKLIEKEKEREELINIVKEEHLSAEKAIERLRKNAASYKKIDRKEVNVPTKYVHAKRIAEAAGGGSNCSDGHKRNCPLGDQTGKEVKFSKWRKGWVYVMRSDDPVKANKAALCMENAVRNDNIGYGQQGFSKWSGLWDYLSKRKDWDVSTVKKKVSVSCCPLVAVCLKYAGFHPTNSLNCQSPASNMRSGVRAAGNFTEVNSRNLTNIRRGDILIASHHMAMAV